jgi:hypothetical protein
VNAIHSVDLFLLKRILRLREFCEEWLSVSCQRFERGLIVLYTAPLLVENLVFGRRHAFRTLMVFAVIFLARWMWRMQQKPDSFRAMLLFQSEGAVCRVALALLALLDLGQIAAPGAATWHDVMMAAPFTFYAMFMVSIALPRGDNKPGRKRKLALAKLKEIFGGWLPAPEGSPA